MKITGVYAYVTEERGRPFTWQVGRPGSGDGRDPTTSRSCILRVTTDEGIEGYAVGRGYIDFDLIERRTSKILYGADPLQSEFIWERSWEIDRLEEYPLYSLGLSDVAVWDIKGKAAGLPVYKLLGGYRDEIGAYASTTSYDTEKEYLDVVAAAVEAGYQSVKLHLRYLDVKTNAALCRSVRKLVGDDFSLTLDASALWNYTDSLWFGRVLEELHFEWYEEPMREFDLESYARLCADLDIPILAAECSDGAHWNAGEFIRRNACDIMRTSVHFKGGFTGGLKVAHLAESYSMNAEVHGGGLTNLNLALAIPNNTWYEDIVIDVEHIRDKPNGALPIKDGIIRLPEGTVGVGWNFDVKDLEKRAIKVFEYTG